MTLDYGGVLRRAWELVWKNKILWLFGILSAMMGGQMSGSGNNFNYRFDSPREVLPPQMQNLDENVILLIVLGIIAVIIVIAIVLAILSVFGRGGLIGGVRLADTQGRVSFGEAWAVGRRKFWTVLAIGLAVWVLGLLLAGVSFISILTICLAPLACIGFLLLALLGVYARLAQIVAVIDDVGVAEALPRAWRFITTNLGALIVMGLILVVIQWIVGFVLSLPIIAIVVPIALSVIGYSNEAPLMGNIGIALAGLCVVVYIPVLIVAGGIVEAWVMSAWTLTYRRLTGPAPAPLAPAAPLA